MTSTPVQLPSTVNDTDFRWIEPGTEIIPQRQLDSHTELRVCDAGSPSSSRLIGIVEQEMTLVQAIQTSDGDVACLFHHISLKEQDAEYPESTGLSFTSLPCVTFDQGFEKPVHRLKFLRIPKDELARKVTEPTSITTDPRVMDVLADSDLVFFPYSGAMPNISPLNCSLAQSGVAFVAQSLRETVQAGRFTSKTYFIPLPGLDEPFGKPTQLAAGGSNGWSAVPRFSGNGRSLSFLREDDSSMILLSRSIFVVRDVLSSTLTTRLKLVQGNSETSSLYPDSVALDYDGTIAYFTAIEPGSQRLFSVPVDEREAEPSRVAPAQDGHGSVMSINIARNLRDQDLCFLTMSSATHKSWTTIFNTADRNSVVLEGQGTPDLGISHAQVVQRQYQSGGQSINTFVMHPPNFDVAKSYPVLLMIHGGPFTAWVDAFFAGFSPAVFAEEGYVVVMPNYTGSTDSTYDFRRKVVGDCGGQAYRDLEACMDFITDKLPHADTSRAICLGGSFGGYLVFWLAGQPLARRFKALISHAGHTFGGASLYASDMPYIWQPVYGGIDRSLDPGDLPGIMDRWDAARYAKNWETPILFTHGARDNRSPTAGSVAAFAHCQLKGVESKLLVFPDESHFILKHENRYHWYREMIAWMNKYSK